MMLKKLLSSINLANLNRKKYFACLILIFLLSNLCRTFSQEEKITFFYQFAPIKYKTNNYQKQNFSFSNNIGFAFNFGGEKFKIIMGFDLSFINKNETGKVIVSGHDYGTWPKQGLFSSGGPFIPNNSLFDSLPTANFNAIYYATGPLMGFKYIIKNNYFISTTVSLLLFDEVKQNYRFVHCQTTAGTNGDIYYGFMSQTFAYKITCNIGRKIYENISCNIGLYVFGFLQEYKNLGITPYPYPYSEFDHRFPKNFFGINLGICYNFGKKKIS